MPRPKQKLLLDINQEEMTKKRARKVALAEVEEADEDDDEEVEVADEVVDQTGKRVDRSMEIMGLLREMEKVVHINAVSFGEETRMHTSLLCLDLLIGGGIAPGWYTFSGPEQSAKTTAAISISAASADQDVDLRVLWDAENSSGSSTDYVARIFSTVGSKQSVDSVFGVRDDKGVYIVPPKIYYRDDPEGAKLFSWLRGVLTRLPDKRFENGDWWYVYDDAKDIMKMKAKLKALDYKIDVKMTARNPGLWVKAPSSSLQLLIVLDSLPSLLPPSQEDDEADNSLAVMARFFSKELPRVKGLFRAKRCAMVAINQLRTNPMQRFGNPEGEPGGQALKFFSDVRLKFYPNALSAAPFAPKAAEDGKGKFESEPSVCGTGTDTYRYISVDTIKNKLSTPGRTKTWLRLWVSDKDGHGMGYDPVFDTFYYLHQTGQVMGKRSVMKLNIQGLGEAPKTNTWAEFKQMVIGTAAQKKAAFAKIGYKAVDLRRGCLGQIRRGVGSELLLANAKKLLAAPKEKIERTADKDEE
jgi:RecA/RadA recombinase